MQTNNDEDLKPSWLDEHNDEIHREECAPLFGSGSLALEDTEEQLNLQQEQKKQQQQLRKIREQEQEQQQLKQKQSSRRAPVPKIINYGSTTTPTQEEHVVFGNGNNFHDEEGGEGGTTIASGESSSINNNTRTSNGRPEIPRPNCIVSIFFFLEGFGMIASLCLFTTQIIPIVQMAIIRAKMLQLQQEGGEQLQQQQQLLQPSPQQQSGSDMQFVSMVLKVYMSVFCLLILLLEWDIKRLSFLQSSAFLQTYISRGFLYSFLGFTSVEEAYSDRVTDMVGHVGVTHYNRSDDGGGFLYVAWMSLFMQVSAWMMVSLGFVYMILGLCCLKRLRDKFKQKYLDKWAVYRQELRIWKEQQQD